MKKTVCPSYFLHNLAFAIAKFCDENNIAIFAQSFNLKTIICSAKLPPHAYMGVGLFPSIDNPYIHVYVPCESVEYYKHDVEWGKLRNLKWDAQKEAEIKQKKLAEQLKRKSIEERKSFAKRELIKYTKQYNDNKRLFPSKEEFDTAYNNATSDSEFIDFIQKKKKQYKILQYLSTTLYGNKNLNLCEAESASTSSKKGQIIHSVIDDMSSLTDKYFHDQGIEYIMQYCPKFKKDYEKNKLYFDSVETFYNSYISANYKVILKAQINRYKNNQ